MNHEFSVNDSCSIIHLKKNQNFAFKNLLFSLSVKRKDVYILLPLSTNKAL